MGPVYTLTIPPRTCRCPVGTACNCDARIHAALAPAPRIIKAPIPTHLLRQPKR